MKKHLLVIVSIFLFIGVGFQPAFANDLVIGIEKQQPRGVTFMKTFGGTLWDRGHYVQQTTDGGYIITGMKDFYPTKSGDVWLIKTDSDGNKLWDKTFGKPEDLDAGECVQQTNDGGYIITGLTYSLYTGDREVFLIKTDNTGNLAWHKTFVGIIGYSVQQTTDGGYIITGDGYGGAFLIKTDNAGNKIWDKNLGGWAGYCVQQTTDGGYILTGETSGSSSNAVWLIKTDSDGNKLWDKTFEKCELENVGRYVQQTTDGGYIIVGRTAMFGKGSLWLIKTDSDGNKMWDRDFFDGYGYCVQQTNDGGYIISGEICSFSGSVYLIKTDSAGKEVWHKTFGGFGFFSGHCVQQTTDGGYIITGISDTLYDDNEDVLLIKTNEYGNVRNKSINKTILNFLQNHPNLFRILQKLLQLF